MNRRDIYTPRERVTLARLPSRPGGPDFINGLIDRFIPLTGDRHFGEDPAIQCGIGFFRGIPVTVAAHKKGSNLAESMDCNFGMPQPEGYRKFLRAVEQAVKFHRPILTFIDTPGAYPGKGAEERGQGDAIAKCLFELSNAPVPVISVVIGEGGSGGALAMGVADKVIMLENATYSVLSPEGFASILWKDPSRVDEACDVMKLTAFDLHEYGVIDHIVPEPEGGAGKKPEAVIKKTGALIHTELTALMKKDSEKLVKDRYTKLRKYGV